MDDRGTDREKKGKDFDFRAKVDNFSAGSLKAKKLQHRMARNSKMCKNVLTPPAVSKVFQGVKCSLKQSLPKKMQVKE